VIRDNESNLKRIHIELATEHVTYMIFLQ